MIIGAKDAESSIIKRATPIAPICSGGESFRVKSTIGLLMAYAFLSPLGNLARFGDEKNALGLTTLILILAVGTNLLPSILITRTNRLLYSLILLVLWMGVSSLFSGDMLGAYLQLANFSFYVLFACLAFSIDWSIGNIRRLLMCLILGGFLCATLTLIDWFGLVDIPRVNEFVASTRTDFGKVLQASGSFARRSAMAAYFSLLIPIATLAFLHIKQLSRTTKVFALITAIISTIALLLTHNRAGILGALLAIGVINILLLRSTRELKRIMVREVILALFFVWLVTTYFPEQLIVYKAKLGIGEIASTDTSLQESDNLRIMLFQHAITSLASNPAGHGYTYLTGVSAYDQGVDPHNNITQIIWAAGLFGMGWLVFFGAGIFNRTKVLFSKRHGNNPLVQYGIVIVGGLMGWFFCGMMHTIIGTGMAWLLFGVLLKIIKVNSRAGELQAEFR